MFPKDANLWDSLGDGYKKNGDVKNAINAYQQAYALNPRLKESIKSLNELGIKVVAIKRAEIDVTVQLLQQYVGRYQLKEGFYLEVEMVENKLQVTPSGRALIKIFAQSTQLVFVESDQYRVRLLSQASEFQ